MAKEIELARFKVVVGDTLSPICFKANELGLEGKKVTKILFDQDFAGNSQVVIFMGLEK